MFNDLSSLQPYLSTRRSGRPRDMIAPGPNSEQLQSIIEMALRTPDHGKLAPWRFITIALQQREQLAHIMAQALRIASPNCSNTQINSACETAYLAPQLIIMVYAPNLQSKIPEVEQLLSAGAAGMNLLHAVHAHGFVGSWITGWAAYDENIRREFCEEHEQITGFFYIGSAKQPLVERPRPEPKEHIHAWMPKA